VTEPAGEQRRPADATTVREVAETPEQTLLSLQSLGGNQAVRRLVQDSPGEPPAGGDVADRIRGKLGRGEPLAGQPRGALESAMGGDFGGVRIHRDAESADLAQRLGARAFTTGQDIFFGSGAYDPASPRGYHTLAHELTHTMQQGPTTATGDGLVVSDPADASERAAESVAAEVTAGRGSHHVQATGGAPVIAREPLAANGPDAPAIEPQNAGKKIATWVGWVDTSVKTLMPVGTVAIASEVPLSAIPASLTKAGWTTGHYPSEAAAVAAVKATGNAGAVFAENGQFVAYHATGETMLHHFTFDNVRWFDDKPWTGVRFDAGPALNVIVTEDGVALRAEHFKSKDDAKSTAPDQAQMPGAGAGDPLAGYKQAFGDPNKAAALELMFPAALRDYALSTLANSRAEVERDIERRKLPNGVPADEIQKMRSTAEYLAGLDQEIEQVNKTIPPDPDELARFNALQARRRVVLARYPMLARIPPEQTAAFAAKPAQEQIQLLGMESVKVRDDIDKTRNNIIDGTLRVGKIKSVVDATIAGLGVSDPTVRKRCQDLAAASGTTVTEDILTIFTIGFGLAAAIATGPLGVAVAAGAFGLGVADAIKQTEEISAEHSATNTALDPTKSLLPAEEARSWGWLVVAWVGVGMDAAQVVSAIKAIKAGAGAIEEGVKVLAKGDEQLAARLRLAAGAGDATEVINEANKAGVAGRLAAPLELDPELEGGVRVYYSINSEGRAVVDVVKYGPKATVGVVLAHESVVKMLRRYDGLLGRLTELIDKLRSLAGFPAKGAPPPFPPGTLAFESYGEAMKLPEVIASRRAALGTALGTESENALRREISYLENELARHEQVVNQMVAEKGLGYIAAAGEDTKKAIAGGMPDIFNHPLIKDPSKYYYRVNPAGSPPYILTRFANADAPALTIVQEGGGWKIAEGALSRAEEAAAMINGWPETIRAAFGRVKDAYPGLRVVPMRGVSSTGKKIGELMTGGQQQRLIAILTKALEKDADGAAKAARAAQDVFEHEITVVRGTDQLRAYNYRLAFEEATKKEASGDLHHLIPLYLGGDHTRLIDIEPKLHDGLHELIDEIRLAEGTSLAPGSVQNAKALNFAEGAGVLFDDGRVQLVRLNPDGTYVLVP
jgi:hypothetical protein